MSDCCIFRSTNCVERSRDDDFWIDRKWDSVDCIRDFVDWMRDFVECDDSEYFDSDWDACQK